MFVVAGAHGTADRIAHRSDATPQTRELTEDVARKTSGPTYGITCRPESWDVLRLRRMQPEPDDDQLLRTPVAAPPNEVIDLCDDSTAPASPEPQASTPALASLTPSDTAQLLRVLSSTYQKSRAPLNASEALDPLQRAFDSRHQGLPEQTPTLRHASFSHCSLGIGCSTARYFVTFTNLLLSLTVSAVPNTQISRRIF